MRLLIVIVLLTFVAPLAIASDGLIEINQACAVNTGCFASDMPGFPVTIGSPGSYVLTSDLDVEGGNGIEVNVEQVTVDLGGFTVRGPAEGCGLTTHVGCAWSGGGTGVYTDFANVTVKSGRVLGFENDGLRLRWYAVVEGVQSRWNGRNGIDVWRHSRVTGCQADSNATDGIRGDDNTTIEGNLVANNGGRGIFLDNGALSIATVVRGNNVVANGTFGIMAGGGTVVAENTVGNNGATGISSYGAGLATPPATVVNNTSYGNDGDGIFVGHGSLVIGNSVTENDGDGIDCAGSSPGSQSSGCLIKDNTSRGNGQYGLHLTNAFATGTEAGYRENYITENASGGVNGGNNMGGNFCAGPGVGSSSCP